LVSGMVSSPRVRNSSASVPSRKNKRIRQAKIVVFRNYEQEVVRHCLSLMAASMLQIGEDSEKDINTG